MTDTPGPGEGGADVTGLFQLLGCLLRLGLIVAAIATPFGLYLVWRGTP